MVWWAGAAYSQGTIDAEFAGAGARALAMGQSFIGLSDDSTSVTFNPAGLLNLERPEISCQLLYTWDNYNSTKPQSTLAKFQKELPAIFKGANFEAVRDRYHDPRLSYSFASFVYPTKKWSFALSSQTVFDNNRFITDQGINAFGRPFDVTRQIKAQLRTYGLTAARIITEDLWVGMTANMAGFTLHYEEADKFDLKNQQVADVREWTWGYNLGMQYFLSEAWTVGAVYRSPFPLEFTYFTGAEPVSLKTPQVSGAGIAYHPDDKLRLGFDVDYVQWSYFVTKDDYDLGLTRNDILRYHLGGEYMLGIKYDSAWFLRGGLMYEPGSALYYYKPATQPYDKFLAASFPGEEDLLKYTCGLGVAREHFQVDCAVNLSGNTCQLILSSIFYF